MCLESLISKLPLSDVIAVRDEIERDIFKRRTLQVAEKAVRMLPTWHAVDGFKMNFTMGGFPRSIQIPCGDKCAEFAVSGFHVTLCGAAKDIAVRLELNRWSCNCIYRVIDDEYVDVMADVLNEIPGFDDDDDDVIAAMTSELKAYCSIGGGV